MSITLLQLRTQSRQRADMENSTFVTDSELNSFINSSIAELHDILVQSYGSGYFVKDVEFNLVSGQQSYDLTSASIITDQDFYKLQGIDIKIDSQVDWASLDPFNFNERNRFNGSGVWNRLGVPKLRYRLVGNNLRFIPVPSSADLARIWYSPVSAKLVNDSDEYDDFNQYSEYAIVDAAIKMLQKEESSTTVFERQKKDLKTRIEEASQNRDAGKPESVSDIHAENDFDYYDWN